MLEFYSRMGSSLWIGLGGDEVWDFGGYDDGVVNGEGESAAAVLGCC